MSTVKIFEVGKRYYMRSACNYEVVEEEECNTCLIIPIK